MSYINETDFVIENKKLVYPEIVTDGLQLYYDAKGKRDTDYHRDTMLDMSGNKNHGKLHNFAYEKHSGYKDGLVFDYIDDKLVRPTLNLKPNYFTFMLNGNIISFSPDGTVKRVQDGEVIEAKGTNLVRNGNFSDGTNRWTVMNGASTQTLVTEQVLRLETTDSYQGIYQTVDFNTTDTYYTFINLLSSSRVQLNTLNAGIAYFDLSGSEYNFVSHSFKYNPVWTKVIGIANVQAGITLVKNFGLINLTKTFGAGNEPTKEQMDEIINRFGFIPNAQDLIDRIEYKGNDLGDMENIIDGLYKTEVLSGEEVYTDKADDAVVHVEVDGKSYQEQSKDLMDEVTIIENTAINQTSTYTGISSGSRFFITEPIDLTGVKSVKATHTATNEYAELRIMFLNSSLNKIQLIEEQSKYEAVWKVPENTKYAVFSSHKNNGNEWTFETNTPSPDYPSEIHSLNDFDVVSSVGGRNLILETKEPLTIIGNGKVNNYKRGYKLYNYLETEKPLTMSLEYEITGINENELPPNFQITVEGFPGWHKFIVTKGNGLTGIVKETSTISSSRSSTTTFQFRVDYLPPQATIKFSKIKIEKDSTATPYSPAPEDILEDSSHLLIDKINLLLDEPLRSAGDAKDRLFRDSDGLWKVERNVGEMVLDGSRNWSTVWLVNNNHGAFILSSFGPTIDASLEKYNLIKSDKFVGVSRDDLDTKGPHIDKEGIAQGATYLALRININRIGSYDVGAFRNWLGNNPVTVYYYLSDKSYIETLPQSIQDKLNNLRSFEDSNYVYTVLPNENNYLSNNLKPTLHAKFLYNNWYKEDRVINNLMIYNRALTNEEMLQNYKTIKRRWGM